MNTSNFVFQVLILTNKIKKSTDICIGLEDLIKAHKNEISNLKKTVCFKNC